MAQCKRCHTLHQELADAIDEAKRLLQFEDNPTMHKKIFSSKKNVVRLRRKLNFHKNFEHEV